LLLIIDNQSQMILQFEARLRQTGIPYRKITHDQPLDFPLYGIRGLVLTGGPGNPYGPLVLSADYIALNLLNVPTVGFCLGHEIIAAYFGGHIDELGFLQDEFDAITLDDRTDSMLCGLPEQIELRKQHKYCVTKLGEQMRCLAHSDTCEFEIIRHRDRPIWGFQSHPEATPGQGEIIITKYLALCGY